MRDSIIALLQIDSDQNDVEGNLGKIISRVGGAAKAGANLIICCEDRKSVV